MLTINWRSHSSFDIRDLASIFRLPMNLLINFCLVLFVLVAALMVLVILMQRPKSEGLGAAFGGGVTENIFGAQTTNVLVKFTTWLAGIFFALTFALSVLYAHHSVASSAFRRELMKNQPRANLTCACGSTIITGRHRNYAGTGFARCFSSRKRSTHGFAKIIARQSSREYLVL